jgi:phospholipase/carboxylesterase
MRKHHLICTIFLFLYSGFFSQTVNTTLTYSVNLPAKTTSRTPVMILLHGYGSNEADLFDLAKALDPRFITFSLRAPNSTADGGFCWYALERLPDAQFKYNYEEAKASRTKILSFISNACKAYHLDSNQVFLMGFSQGSIMAYDISLYAPGKIKGVLALSGRMMEESTTLKTDTARLAKVKFFIGHGSSDNLIKIEEAAKAEAFLRKKHVKDITSLSYEMPHSICGKVLNDIKAWVVKAISPAQKVVPPKK